LGSACGGESKDHRNASSSAGGDAASGGAGGSTGNVIGGCQRGFQPLDEADPRCGDDPCSELPMPNDGRFRFSDRCCTTDEACGSGSEEIFGATCFERDQAGNESAGCPGASVFLYVDPGSDVAVVPSFPGCCRADGLCGFDTSATLGAGCVERSRFAAALRSGCISANLDASFETMACP
jgi:hypothetical protein